MLSVPTDPAVVANLDEWWVERRANAYASLRIGNPKLAYELVRNAGPLTVNPLKDQTFIAGWLALRYLKDASAAEKHFQAMSKAADGPLTPQFVQPQAGRRLGQARATRVVVPGGPDRRSAALQPG